MPSNNKETIMHLWRQRATSLAVLLFLMAAPLAAAEPEDDDADKNKTCNVTSWIYNGCETGSVDAPDSDDVYAWFALRNETNSLERVVKVSMVPEWSDNNRTLVCNENSILVDSRNTTTELYTRGGAYGCQASQDALEFCATLHRLGVPCDYHRSGVWSNGRCRNETNAAKCEREIWGDFNGRQGKASFDPFPVQVGGTNDTTRRANGTLEEADAMVSVAERGNTEDRVTLSSWPNTTTVWAEYTEDRYTLLFDNPRFGRAYVLATVESVVHESIVNKYLLTRVKVAPYPHAQFHVPVQWTGRTTYQVVFVADAEQCQYYISSHVLEFIVEAPWYETINTFPECNLCESTGIGNSTTNGGPGPPVVYNVLEGGTNYAHSCDSLFIAGRRGQIPKDRCSIVRAYPCCQAALPKSSSSSSSAAAAAAAAASGPVSASVASLILVLLLLL
jgi:hypothetical protein